jgi:hypothetical protein
MWLSWISSTPERRGAEATQPQPPFTGASGIDEQQRWRSWNHKEGTITKYHAYAARALKLTASLQSRAVLLINTPCTAAQHRHSNMADFFRNLKGKLSETVSPQMLRRS